MASANTKSLPQKKGMSKKKKIITIVVAAVLAVVLLIVTAVWLWLKCGEKGIDPERIKNERVEK